MSFPVVSFADYVGLEVIDRSDLTICDDPPLKLDVCELHVVLDNAADRLISVAFSNVSTTDPAGFYQHTFGSDTSPRCSFIPVFPTLVCDSFVTLGEECDDGDASTTDPDFDGTGFNSSGTASGGWYNSAPANGQGAPDANDRVMIARFSYKQSKTTTGDVCVFTKLAGSEEITSFLIEPFDCAVPGMQAGGGGGAPPGGGGGANECIDVPFEGSTMEPAIAVNPLDPSNIAVSWIPLPGLPALLTVSTDGGKTWCQEGLPCSTPLTAVCPLEDSLTGADPTLAFDSSGHLYWCNLCIFQNPVFNNIGIDVVVLQVDPVTGAAIGDPVVVLDDVNMRADKEWFAIGPQPDGTGDRLYLVWYNHESVDPEEPLDTYVAFSYTDDLSTGWTPPVALSPSIVFGEDFPIAHVAASPATASPLSGGVFVAYHSQPGYNFGEDNTDGVSGEVIFRRSLDGGVTWEDPVTPYEGGEADITWNFQDETGSIPNTRFCAAGSIQPWIVPDPLDSDRIYIVAADDPNNMHGDPDDSLVYIVASSDAGGTWDALGSVPEVIHTPDPPDDSFQVFPTAAIDPVTGDLAVLWYDNSNDQQFEDLPENPGNFLFYLDVFFSISTDQGVTFSEPRQLNDQPVNEVLADSHSSCLGHDGGTRIGEYIGVALATDTTTGEQLLHSAWTGNSINAPQVIFGTAVIQLEDCPADLNGDEAVGPSDLASLLASWGMNPCGPPDFNGDGDVGPFDLASLLASWGPCP